MIQDHDNVYRMVKWMIRIVLVSSIDINQKIKKFWDCDTQRLTNFHSLYESTDKSIDFTSWFVQQWIIQCIIIGLFYYFQHCLKVNSQRRTWIGLVLTVSISNRSWACNVLFLKMIIVTQETFFFLQKEEKKRFAYVLYLNVIFKYFVIRLFS